MFSTPFEYDGLVTVSSISNAPQIFTSFGYGRKRKYQVNRRKKHAELNSNDGISILFYLNRFLETFCQLKP